MTLLEHLLELRARLFKALLGLLAGCIAGFVLYPQIFDFLKHPYCRLPAAHRGLGGAGCQLFQFGVFEGFAVRLHVAIIAGVILSSPLWLYQLWAYITPALHRNERRWAVTFVGCSLALFAAGAAVAFVMLNKALEFLLSVAGHGVSPVLGITPYLNFVTLMLVIFGVSFEFPLLIVMLNLAGVLSSARLRSWRRMEIFLVFAFAAVATPSQDPFTMTALAIPMALLYEAAVVVARVHDRRVAQRAAASPYADLSPDEPSPLDLTRS
jgi:sec-independent protein translocase protein TatC